MKSNLIITCAICAIALLSTASLEASSGSVARLVLHPGFVADQAAAVSLAPQNYGDLSSSAFVSIVRDNCDAVDLAESSRTNGHSMFMIPATLDMVSSSSSAGICNAVSFVDCVV